MSCVDFKWMQCLVIPNYRIETRKYLASLISRYLVGLLLGKTIYSFVVIATVLQVIAA